MTWRDEVMVSLGHLQLSRLQMIDKNKSQTTPRLSHDKVGFEKEI